VIPARRRGGLALAGAGLSVLLMCAVGVAGPSAAEPGMGHTTPLPPWHGDLRPGDGLVVLTLWTAIAVATASVLVGLSAVRAGWRPSPRALLAGGLLAAAALAVVPPVGSSDLMDYSTYGRIASLGHSPYSVSPAHMVRLHDPIARYSSRPWRLQRSVYGPVATAEEYAIAKAGGTSIALDVLGLKLVNALAFLAAALALDRLVRPEGRARAHLLWTANPLMLWSVVGGGHVDGLALALSLTGLCLVRNLARPGWARVFAGGLLVGAAAAVKLPYLLLAVAPLWTLRRDRRAAAVFAAGGFAALVPGYLAVAGPAYRALVRRDRGISEMSVWHLAVKPLGYDPAVSLPVAGIVAAVLVAVFLRGLPGVEPEGAGVRIALALCLAWVIASQVYYPWYEVMILPLLALLPATRADSLLVARAGIAAFGSLPGMARFYHPHWVDWLVNQGAAVAAPAALALFALLLVAASLARSWGMRPAALTPLGEVP
jgi:hypothetical protein